MRFNAGRYPDPLWQLLTGVVVALAFALGYAQRGKQVPDDVVAATGALVLKRAKCDAALETEEAALLRCEAHVVWLRDRLGACQRGEP